MVGREARLPGSETWSKSGTTTCLLVSSGAFSDKDKHREKDKYKDRDRETDKKEDRNKEKGETGPAVILSYHNMFCRIWQFKIKSCLT